MPTSEQVKQIKRSFRLYMNGVAAASMRRKGLDYKINWGIQLPDLKRMASQYGQDAELARALWAESGVRECRLLATLIMPPGQLDCDEAVRWATTSQLTSEIMEMAVFNLFQHAECADSLALQMLRQPVLMLCLKQPVLTSLQPTASCFMPSCHVCNTWRPPTIRMPKQPPRY